MNLLPKAKQSKALSRKLSLILFFLLIGFFENVRITFAATTVQIGNAILNNFQIISAAAASDPCAGTPAIGTICTGGALYAGTYNGHSYMTTPSNCTDYVDNHTAFSPTCNGATDTVIHKWANNSGTTAYNVVTGATSTVDGSVNTTTLLSYTDTDAARYCHYMNYGGYADWYLPAASLANDANGEFKNVLYANRAAIGGFQSWFYASSTEASASNSMTLYIVDGSQGGGAKTYPLSYVRCVRRY